jgi:hypothetical protein
MALAKFSNAISTYILFNIFSLEIAERSFLKKEKRNEVNLDSKRKKKKKYLFYLRSDLNIKLKKKISVKSVGKSCDAKTRSTDPNLKDKETKKKLLRGKKY